MPSEVKTMLALFVPEGFNEEWMNAQMNIGGFDRLRDVIQISAYETAEDDSPVGTWLMQEVISKIH